ncbi:hypothetical protein B005_4176 [Nocardiopsis alba ATCC BAA-2165]|uniref:Uncharacterized protein n=1 Tax=Nocardiopsis alba (strain ATCC BAA-2165 / BE74) TaxID=1205910 RepID=J7LJI4_NOCAA|nr:hypothetical protein B005_4176 [Nocardiopsis alba ATCC BAA-2165]
MTESHPPAQEAHMSEQQSKKDLPPEAMGNEKWHDTTDVV